MVSSLSFAIGKKQISYSVFSIFIVKLCNGILLQSAKHWYPYQFTLLYTGYFLNKCVHQNIV
jgi:hypothetical protein